MSITNACKHPLVKHPKYCLESLEAIRGACILFIYGHQQKNVTTNLTIPKPTLSLEKKETINQLTTSQ
jgi:hypothetical protein